MGTPRRSQLMPAHLAPPSPLSSPTTSRASRSTTSATLPDLTTRSSRTPRSVPDAAASHSTPTLAGIAAAVEGLAADLRTIKSDLRKSLTEQGVLMAEIDQLSTAYAELLSMNHGLYELVLTLTSGAQSPGRAESNGDDTVTTPPPSPAPPAQALPPPRRPPFRENSKMVYVMIRGRCPGFYTSLPWVQTVLIANQPEWDNCWQGFPSLELAVQHWEDNKDMVKFTGRVDGDEHLYGPREVYIPF